MGLNTLLILRHYREAEGEQGSMNYSIHEFDEDPVEAPEEQTAERLLREVGDSSVARSTSSGVGETAPSLPVLMLFEATPSTVYASNEAPGSNDRTPEQRSAAEKDGEPAKANEPAKENEPVEPAKDKEPEKDNEPAKDNKEGADQSKAPAAGAESNRESNAPLRVPGFTVNKPDRVQRDLANGEIVQNDGRKRGGNSGHEQYTGVVQAPDGTRYSVYLRHMNKEDAVSRLRKELAAYRLNSMLEFDNGFPPTSVRRFTVDGKEKFGAVQVAAGEQLELEMTHMASQRYGSARTADIIRLLDEDPKLRRALEQAYLERMVYGDEDAHSLNFLVRQTKDGVKVANIDLDHGFSRNPVPELVTSTAHGVNKDLFEYFQKKPIAAEFREKLSGFLKKYDNDEGRKELQALGLSRPEVDAMLSRTRWLVEKGKFPEAISVDEAARRKEEREGAPVSDAERRQRDIERTRFRRGLNYLTQVGEEGTDMVSRIGMMSEDVLRKSGLWDAVQAMNPAPDTVRDAYERAVSLEERGTTLTRAQAEVLDGVKKLQASGLQIRTTEQLQTLMKATVQDLNSGDGKLTPQEQREVDKLLAAYAAKDPIVRDAVHEALGLKKAQPKVEPPLKPPATDQSVRDIKRESLPPEQRAARVAAIVEKGVLREVLTKAGISEEAARSIEKDLLSEKKDEQERAQRAIERHYAGKGGYRAFLSEAKGKLGATAVVVSALIPAILETDK